MNDTNGHLRIQAEYFSKNYKPVHVKLKSGKFYNGYILEVGADFFIFNDRIKGEQPIFFVQIDEMEQYTSINPSEEKDGK